MNSSQIPTSGGSSLQGIEAALLQLLAAVRSQGNGFSASQSPLPSGNAWSVTELCNEFLLSKSRSGRSDSYLALLVKQLRSFCAEGRGEKMAALITSTEVESFAYGQMWKPKTVKNMILTLRTVFAFAMARNQILSNPALPVDLPMLANEPPGIHTPEEARQVLETARRIDMNAMRCFAIRYFAGLRTSEATALEEREIGERFIEVTAAKAKTRRRRLVTIQPVLCAWLDLGGELPLAQVNNRLRAVTLAAGVPWPNNACRHSFVSYHLAKFGSASRTALEAGHTEQMLFNHYRELVKPDAAEAYFNLFPNPQTPGKT